MKKKMCIFFILLISFLFIGNIGLHMILISSVSEAEITETKSYSVEGNKYMVVSQDPQILIGNLKGNIDSICIEFDQALEQDIDIQLFLPDQQGMFSEERSYKWIGKKGEDKVQVEFPEGEYETVRIDMDGTFSLKRIYQLPFYRQFAFTDESVCYCVWTVCALSALLVTILGERIPFVTNRFEKIYWWISKLRKKIVNNKWAGQVVVGTALALVGGMSVEFIVSMINRALYNKSEMLIITMLFFTIYTAVFMRKWYVQKIELMVCVIMIVCGMIFTTVMPVSVGISWDDEIHYFQTAKAARALSGVVSTADEMFKDTYKDIIYKPEKNYSREGQKAKIKQYNEEYEKGDYSVVEGGMVSINSIGYIPSIIGMWIGFGLFLPFSATIILMRFVNVLFIAVLLYFAMKNVKTGKMLIPVFALVPTVFFLASSFSYDTWLTMLLLYGFTRYFGELQQKDKKFTLRDFLLIVYARMLFLTAYMPSKKFKDKKWCYAYRACFIVGALVCVAGITFILSGRMNLGTGDTRGGDVNPMMQLAYIISNFSRYGKTLADFLTNYFSYNNSSTYLTFMAYAGERKWQWFQIILLFFVAFTDRIPEVDRKTIPVICKLESVVMVWIMGAICATVMYLAFTPVGLDQINGCQGRYIIPALFPMLYSVSRWGTKSIVRAKVKQEYYNIGIIVVSVVFLMCNLWINIVSKY